jgi:hypothetical protein
MSASNSNEGDIWVGQEESKINQSMGHINTISRQAKDLHTQALSGGHRRSMRRESEREGSVYKQQIQMTNKKRKKGCEEG